MNSERSNNTYDVFILPEDDVRYVLEFEKTSGTVIMTYYDQGLPILKQKPIHKIIKRTYVNSTLSAVFSKALDNYKAKREDRKIEYEPTKTFTKPKDKTWDLTDISNNMKPMPQDFRNFMFKVSGSNSRIQIRSFVSKADIDKFSLNTVAMNHYLSQLDNFELIDRKAGWPKI